MGADDLDRIQCLLGDPAVMAHYDHPKSRDECLGWIEWNVRGYARDGFGLWLLELPDGTFVGECGLTWQPVDGETLELGYHLLPSHQGQGLATDAALACLRLARDRGIESVIAVIVPGNAPSVRLAERVGMLLERRDVVHGADCLIYRTKLIAPDG